MDAFGYLSVLLSIILGLGLAHLLTSIGRLIRARDRVTLYGPPIVWALVLTLIYVQTWWSMFGLRERTQWTFVEFLVVLLQTVALYMVAALALPEFGEAGPVDLRAYYKRQSPWFFGFLMATIVISVVKDVLLNGELPERANLAFHAMFFASCAAATVVRREWYHQLAAWLAAVGISSYIALLFSRLH